MDPLTISALIGAGGSLAGGLLNNQANKQNNASTLAMAEKQYQQQKEFAQSGIQWKVADAEKAGIHPLFALGANTVSYSPQSVGTSPSNFDFLGETGQNIGRAIDATRSNPAKMSALAQTAAQIQLEGFQLDNDLKRTQLASAATLANQAGSAPGLPSTSTMPALTGMEGQGNAPQIDGPLTQVQNKIAPVSPGARHVEYGAGPEVLLKRTKSGYSVVIPQDLSEAYEQDFMGRYQWMARNKLATDTKIARTLPKRPGRRWTYFPAEGQYRSTLFPAYSKRQRRERNPHLRWLYQ